MAVACQTCHPRQSLAHAGSAHARSLRAATDARWASLRADWAFGAGKQAVTFVSRDGDEHYVEHGSTYYTALDRFDITPGHSTGTGVRYRIFDPSAAILRCFQCHATGRLTVGADGRIDVAQPGVSCEACHGPVGTHIASRGPIHNPGRLTAAAMNNHCGACHRMPAPAGSDTDFSDPWNARHQPMFLARSACFLKSARSSGQELKCITCHDAHSGQTTSACGRCHRQVKHSSAVSGTCESCHMPLVRPREGLVFANHWIAVYGADPLRPRAR